MQTDFDSALSFHYKGFGQQIVVGEDVIRDVGNLVDSLGARRAMIVCGQSILENSDVVGRVGNALQGRLVGRFDAVQPHSSLKVLDEATEVARGLNPDVIVSVGGGSSITIAKGMALALSTDRDVRDFERRFEPPSRVVDPDIAIPPISTAVIAVATTMGSAEIGGTGGGFADPATGRKVFLYAGGATSAKIVVVDGLALATTPASIQRAGVIAQIRVAIESFYSIHNNPIGDGLALHAVGILSQAIRDGWHADDVGYLLRVKAASLMAELALGAVGSLGLNSAIAHHLGPRFGIPHGQANAVLLPHTVRFNSRWISETRLAALQKAMAPGSAKSPTADHLADIVADLCQRMQVPSRLRDLSVRKTDFPSLAAATLGDWSLRGNPVAVEDQNPIIEILDAAW